MTRFTVGTEVKHHSSPATGTVAAVEVDAAPSTSARVIRTLAGESLPPFTFRPAYLIEWHDGRQSWSRDAFLWKLKR